MSASNSSQSLAGSVDMELAGSGVEYGCKRVSTLGYWNETDNWDTGVAPTEADEVGLARKFTYLCRRYHILVAYDVYGVTSYRKDGCASIIYFTPLGAPKYLEMVQHGCHVFCYYYYCGWPCH